MARPIRPLPPSNGWIRFKYKRAVPAPVSVGNGSSDSAVAILKRMDRLKIQMCRTGPGERWQWLRSCRSRALEPVDESRHFAGDLRGRRCLEMNLRRTDCP